MTAPLSLRFLRDSAERDVRTCDYLDNATVLRLVRIAEAARAHLRWGLCEQCDVALEGVTE